MSKIIETVTLHNTYNFSLNESPDNENTAQPWQIHNMLVTYCWGSRQALDIWGLTEFVKKWYSLADFDAPPVELTNQIRKAIVPGNIKSLWIAVKIAKKTYIAKVPDIMCEDILVIQKNEIP
jgi:hypothetical protein